MGPTSLYLQQVLHYSALQAGVVWLATSITSVALAGASQKLVTLISPGPVMALGMALIGGGFQWALWVCGAIALPALPTTLALVRRRAATAIPAATEAVRSAAAR